MNGIPFASVFKAQEHYATQFRHNDSMRPLVILQRYHRNAVPMNKLSAIEIPLMQLAVCTRVWTYLFVYMESVRSDDSVPTEPSSEGEMPGRVFAYGFVNSAWLQQQAKLHSSLTVRREHLTGRPFSEQSHLSYDFYQSLPLCDYRELTMPEIEDAIETRVQLMTHVSTQSCLAKPMECKAEQLGLLHLNTRKQVELDYIVFSLLAWGCSRSAYQLRLDDEAHQRLVQQWVDMELSLLQYRLFTCAADRMDNFLPAEDCELYTRDRLLTAVLPNTPMYEYITRVEPLTEKFVVTPFEDACYSSAFGRRCIYLKDGSALYPLVYALPLIMHNARESLTALLNRLKTMPRRFQLRKLDRLEGSISPHEFQEEVQLHRTSEQHYNLTQTAMRSLYGCMKWKHELQQLKKLQIGTISLSQAMKWAPKCIRSLLHRTIDADPSKHLKHNERVKLSQCASALGIDWDELSAAVSKHLQKVYRTPQERTAALKTLRFAYERKNDKAPSCKRMLEFNLCPHVETAKRQNMEPQHVCANELTQRTQRSVQILYNPQFYFSLAKKHIAL